MISWGLYDLILILGQLACGSQSGLVVRRFAFGTLSVLFLWAGVLAAGNGTGSVQWSFMPPGGAKMTLWVLAGLLRLGAYPFHFSIPLAEAASPPVATFLLGPAMGWALWMRLVLVNEAVLADNTWLLAPAAMTLVVGGFLGWAAESPRERRSWIGIGICGAVMLAVVMAPGLGSGEESRGSIVLPIMALGATGWLLSVPVVALGGNLDTRHLSRRWSWLPTTMSVLGALHLVGLPPTMGFAARSSLVRGLATAETWGWTAGAFVGQLLLVAAVTRWLAPTSPPEGLITGEGSVLRRMVQGAGLTCPVLLILGAGLFPMLLVGDSAGRPLDSSMAGPGATSWLLWAGALILGALLGWRDTYVRRRVSLWLNVLRDFVRLDWVLVLLVGAFEQGLAVVRAVDDVLGGRGALLWALIMFLLAILVWRVS
jgi:MYXO-CTERM domain-containing protein